MSRLIWTRQPQVAVDIDRSNPVNSQARLLVHPPRGIARINAVGDAGWTNTSAELVATPLGIEVSTNGSTFAKVDTPLLGASLAPSTLFTMAIVFTPRSSTLSQCPFSFANTTLANPHVSFRVNVVAGQVSFNWRDSAPVTAAFGVGSFAAGEVQRAVMVNRGASNRTLFVNGLQVSDTTTLGTTDLDNTAIVTYHRSTALLIFNGTVAFVYCGFGAWSDAQALAFTTNQQVAWQQFAPLPRRIWAPAAAGGVTHTTTGALNAAAATIAGTSAHLTLHATSGALSSAAATVSGTATHLTLHTTTGALSAAAATIAGTAVHPHTTTGALTADAATIAGAAAHLTLHTTTGALSAAAAVIAGTAVHSAPGTHTTTGALAADAATVAGTAAHLTLHTTTGALAATQAVISGAATHLTLHTTSGALVASSAIVAGLALNGIAPAVTVGYGDLSFGALPKRKRRSLALEGLREELEQALSPPAAAPSMQAHPAWEPVAFVPELAAALTAVRRAAAQSPEVVEIRTIRRAITLAHEAQATYKRKVRRQRQQHYLLMEL